MNMEYIIVKLEILFIPYQTSMDVATKQINGLTDITCLQEQH